MNIFSVETSHQPSFFFPRYRQRSLRRGHRRHQLLLPLGDPPGLSHLASQVLVKVSHAEHSDEESDGDGGGGGRAVGRFLDISRVSLTTTSCVRGVKCGITGTQLRQLHIWLHGR